MVPKNIILAELPLLTGQKVGNVGNAFPSFIQEAPRLQLTLKIFYFITESLRMDRGMLKYGYYSLH